MRPFVLLLATSALAADPVPAPTARTQLDPRVWMADFRKADARRQAVLLRDWHATEGSIANLLTRCRPEDRATATTLLTNLWTQNRLAADDRRTLVLNTVTFRLAERAGCDATGGQRELVLRAERSFSFPKGTWFEWSYAVAIGPRQLRLDTTSGNSRDWEGAGPLDIGTFGCWGQFGAPTARALLEVREVKRGQVVWRQSFEVGPTTLSLMPAKKK